MKFRHLADCEQKGKVLKHDEEIESAVIKLRIEKEFNAEIVGINRDRIELFTRFDMDDEIKKNVVSMYCIYGVPVEICR